MLTFDIISGCDHLILSISLPNTENSCLTNNSILTSSTYFNLSKSRSIKPKATFINIFISPEANTTDSLTDTHTYTFTKLASLFSWLAVLLRYEKLHRQKRANLNKNGQEFLQIILFQYDFVPGMRHTPDADPFD